MSGRGTPALAALAAAGIAHVVHEYTPPEPAAGRDGRPHYGLDAAAAIGVEPARIFKTLVVSVDGRLVVGVVPAGIAVATLHFLLGGLILARRFWSLLVTVLLVLAVVTLFPLGLDISWPFLSLTILYSASLLLTIARQAEFG